MIWACPLCQQALSVEASVASCPHGHRFDRARQGYLNLLPAHHKRSRAPGDDRQMLLQRREFLQRGHYQPLAAALQGMAADFVAQRETLTLLDTGCGEGYYLSEIQRGLEQTGKAMELYGSDISKEAARLAAAQYKDIRFAVASSFQLPVLTDSVDLVLRIFAPGDVSEVLRVLKPGGQFWRVVPGPRHLQELKQELYQQPKLHRIPEVPEGMIEVAMWEVKATMSLTSAQEVAALLQMTPFVWRGSQEGRARLQSMQSLSVTTEFVVQCYDAT